MVIICPVVTLHSVYNKLSMRGDFMEYMNTSQQTVIQFATYQHNNFRMHQVLLLAGQDGFGKTYTYHMLARQMSISRLAYINANVYYSADNIPKQASVIFVDNIDTHVGDYSSFLNFLYQLLQTRARLIFTTSDRFEGITILNDVNVTLDNYHIVDLAPISYFEYLRLFVLPKGVIPTTQAVFDASNDNHLLAYIHWLNTTFNFNFTYVDILYYHICLLWDSNGVDDNTIYVQDHLGNVQYICITNNQIPELYQMHFNEDIVYTGIAINPMCVYLENIVARDKFLLAINVQYRLRNRLDPYFYNTYLPKEVYRSYMLHYREKV